MLMDLNVWNHQVGIMVEMDDAQSEMKGIKWKEIEEVGWNTYPVCEPFFTLHFKPDFGLPWYRLVCSFLLKSAYKRYGGIHIKRRLISNPMQCKD